MLPINKFARCSLLACVLNWLAAPDAMCAAPEHDEFEATLHAPYRAADRHPVGRPRSRTFTLVFDHPMVARPQQIRWTLDLLTPRGRSVRHWHGTRLLSGSPVTVRVAWAGRPGTRALPNGLYRVRMLASTRDANAAPDARAESVEQSWEIAVGPVQSPRIPRFQGLPRAQAAQSRAIPAPGSLPYTVYLGNLHSQSNHSDGGGNVASCASAQPPQGGQFGPADAYAYALDHGLDILATTEHNHLYGGSANASANGNTDPTVARALFHSGLALALDFTDKHPDFLALYGLEWGVIAGGGHLNIFNTTELLAWETAADGRLFGDTLTPKSDYRALYALMRQRGWIGQFNHPALSGQFLIDGVALGYTGDGDAVMTLCEVTNSYAFSSNTSEAETRRSNYEAACDKALEAGYHVAFSSDQDNHCANWGTSYTNRTGVLIPNGTRLAESSFLEALRARRVFATMDKGSQLILTANGHLMGERFSNAGALTLVTNFSSTTGKSVASVALLEGVPGRNGTVSTVSSTAVTRITPVAGEHFYYARVTQTDGNILWSAPVWVTQS
jgi:hypothetical protein